MCDLTLEAMSRHVVHSCDRSAKMRMPCDGITREIVLKATYYPLEDINRNNVLRILTQCYTTKREHHHAQHHTP